MVQLLEIWGSGYKGNTQAQKMVLNDFIYISKNILMQNNEKSIYNYFL